MIPYTKMHYFTRLIFTKVFPFNFWDIFLFFFHLFRNKWDFECFNLIPLDVVPHSKSSYNNFHCSQGYALANLYGIHPITFKDLGQVGEKTQEGMRERTNSVLVLNFWYSGILFGKSLNLQLTGTPEALISNYQMTIPGRQSRHNSEVL